VAELATLLMLDGADLLGEDDGADLLAEGDGAELLAGGAAETLLAAADAAGLLISALVTAGVADAADVAGATEADAVTLAELWPEVHPQSTTPPIVSPTTTRAVVDLSCFTDHSLGDRQQHSGNHRMPPTVGPPGSRLPLDATSRRRLGTR
jgi:hypothetical protein